MSSYWKFSSNTIIIISAKNIILVTSNGCLIRLREQAWSVHYYLSCMDVGFIYDFVCELCCHFGQTLSYPVNCRLPWVYQIVSTCQKINIYKVLHIQQIAPKLQSLEVEWLSIFRFITLIFIFPHHFAYVGHPPRQKARSDHHRERNTAEDAADSSDCQTGDRKTNLFLAKISISSNTTGQEFVEEIRASTKHCLRGNEWL